MTVDVEQGPDRKPALRVMLPPYLLLRDFLDEQTAAGLLDFALANEANYAPTKTGRTGAAQVRPQVRLSVSLHDLGPFRRVLRDKVKAMVPDLSAKLGATPPADPKFEIELVAHNDGAFYKRHIDTQTASDRDYIRVLSAVYYFYVEPKAFSGGALRLYAIGDAEGTAFVDVIPEHNSLLVFPAWAPHEVMPVSCPSQRFTDSRFAINCWVHRARVQGS